MKKVIKKISLVVQDWLISFYKLFIKTEAPLSTYYIDARLFYINKFNEIPSIAEILGVNDKELYQLIVSNKFGKVKKIHQYNSFTWHKKILEFEITLFELDNKMMIKLDNGDAYIYYLHQNFEQVHQIINEFHKYEEVSKEEVYEMNIITLVANGLELKPIRITPTDLDLNLYYNNDFADVDKTIKERLSRDKDKGIILLHGLPGTGKTTYLRHLIGSLKKKVMFVSPSVASNLMNPEFMDLLIDNPNSVLVIEDAENIIMDRRFSSMSSVSNLLNISDGLLSDCLNVQIVCTFNSEISLIDSALLRKGRLIAKYEFGKLSMDRAQTLSNHLGFDRIVTKPMTLAEITNPNENFGEVKSTQVIGFKRYDELLVN